MMGCALQQRDRLCELKLGFENYLLACEKELTTEQMSTLSTLASLEKRVDPYSGSPQHLYLDASFAGPRPQKKAGIP